MLPLPFVPSADVAVVLNALLDIYERHDPARPFSRAVRVRMAEARKLLETSTLKAVEISAKTGFSRSNHFFRTFRKQGMQFVIVAGAALLAAGAVTFGLAALLDLPYALAGGGHEVIYTPSGGYVGQDAFQFIANDGGNPPTGGELEQTSDGGFILGLWISAAGGGGSPFTLVKLTEAGAISWQKNYGTADDTFSSYPTPFAADKQVVRRARGAYGDLSALVVHYMHPGGHRFYASDAWPVMLDAMQGETTDADHRT
jgi:hypothetical protein